MAEIININLPKPSIIVVDEEYIKDLKSIIHAQKKIEENQSLAIKAIIHHFDTLIKISKQGNYGEHTDKVMLEIENLTKIIEVFKNTKY